MLKTSLSGLLFLTTLSVTNALFWSQAPAAPQATLFQPPAALTGYQQGPQPSNGYDTEPATTKAPLLPPPPPVLPTACIPPPPPPIQFPALHLNDGYAQGPPPVLPTLPPFKPIEFPTLPPPKPIEWPTLPPPVKFPTFGKNNSRKSTE